MGTALLRGSQTLDLRREADEYIGAGDAQDARRCLDELWRGQKRAAEASFLVARYEEIRDRLELVPHKLAISRSFTVEPLVHFLRACGYTAGIDLSVHLGDFNAYAQDILDPTSTLYAFAPDTVVLATQTRDLAPDLWSNYADLTAQQRSSAVQRVVENFRNLVHTFRMHSSANLIVHSLEEPPVSSQGILDSQSQQTQRSAINEINHALRHLAGEYSCVYVLDYDGLVARHGRARWNDDRKWLTVRMPIAADYLIFLAQEWLRFLHPLTGKVAKALVVDLDNTLWGGVVGEDGPGGIRLGTEYPGACYQAVQRTLLDLYQRGILLAVCSKNNPDDAMDILQHHPGMILSPSHFAAIRINWNEKAQNLREIASELNIGTDVLAFMDDNPAERERVRAELPQVTVIELSGSPTEYSQILRDCPAFERLVLSKEDQSRGEFYIGERQRAEIERSYSSLEDFYQYLQQEVEISAVTAQTLPRIAQLTQKTNQFNLTTRRYTEQQILDRTAETGWRVFSMRVRDRYGDNGLVGVAIVRDCANVWELDSFLLSCRVIGRTVETAFLSYLVAEARAQGATQIQGWLFPTKKNTPAKDFYPRHGFHLEIQNDQGSLWALDIRDQDLRCPDWIRLIVCRGENH